VDEGFAGFMLFNLANSFDSGYAYESSLTSTLANTNKGPHEILLKVQL
jgi:hypothetical protein